MLEGLIIILNEILAVSALFSFSVGKDSGKGADFGGI